jgi:hypothetical protein
MKFLQLTTQKILELGKDNFDLVGHINLLELTSVNPMRANAICLLSDTYQSRPLLEIDGFCEFDVLVSYEDNQEYSYLVVVNNGALRIADYSGAFVVYHHLDDEWVRDCGLHSFMSVGSIFLPKNQARYPELYQKTIKLINQ